MKSSFDLSVDVSEQYLFHKDSLNKIEQNPWVKNNWPLVYFIVNEDKKEAYVGESTNALRRIKSHLGNHKRQKLKKISIIGSDKFNKSATLEIESNLIQFLHGEEIYNLQNRHDGLINHHYYQQDLYKNLFKVVWEKLRERKIVTKTLTEIQNSALFKYSPYKALSSDQYDSVLEILGNMSDKDKTNRIFVSGSAGTGKTILAIYLIKLLTSNVNELQSDDNNKDELEELSFVRDFQSKYPKAKIGLVVAMTSLRESLENVFRKTPGLKASMIINPSDTFRSSDKYDLLIVDEAHRLRKYKNISWRGAFRKNNQKLGLDDSGTELDWIIANSKNQLFFYDSAQSIKPSDVDQEKFNALLNHKDTLRVVLKSQMRVSGGRDYIQFVDDVLNVSKKTDAKFHSDKYDLLFFDSIKDLVSELQKKETEYGLCRLVAGYSWEWKSDPKKKNAYPDAIDIEIEDLKFQWNHTYEDWINNPKDPKKPLKEIGCIHTVQGYDLNYTGIIFGHEINYNPETCEIEIDATKYYDKYGRIGASDIELKNYIINIYKTLMYRGVKGTYVYACNEELRKYLKQHIEVFKKQIPFRILHEEEVKRYVNCIPLVDISVAAGDFSDLQLHSESTWIEPPFNISAKQGLFVCKIIGESMNKIIPNGSYCLFRQYEGGSRNGKICLVQSTSIDDSEFGSGYTVKKYHSEKNMSGEEWRHMSITLEPLSTSDKYEDIVLYEDDLSDFKVIGLFDRVLK
jgi:DUF2075 family protein/DNA replication protein DnaC